MEDTKHAIDAADAVGSIRVVVRLHQFTPHFQFAAGIVEDQQGDSAIAADQKEKWHLLRRGDTPAGDRRKLDACRGKDFACDSNGYHLRPL
jgi:hypothetical protein